MPGAVHPDIKPGLHPIPDAGPHPFEGYERLSRSAKYLDLDIPAVVRFVRIWVVGTSLGLVLITKGRLIPGLVIII
jgi:hypothetical protein